MPAAWESAPTGLVPLSIKVGGLNGGHCEWDIHKQRANAIILMSRTLNAIQKKFDIQLVKFDGGVQNNVIPSVSSVEILVQPNEQVAVTNLIKELTDTYKNEYSTADPGLTIQVNEIKQYPEKVFGEPS